MNSSPIAVIFDMDGVLVDSHEAHYEAFRRIGEKVGAPFTVEMMLSMVGMHNNQIFPRWLGPALTAERARELADEKEAIYRSVVADTLKAVPGVVELIRALDAERIPMAVGSSGPRENVELAVRTLGLAPYFRAIVTGSDVRHGKPAPEIFLKAAAGLGHAPDRCLVIEDAPSGIQAALAGGMRVVAVTTSRPAADLRAAHRVVESLKELSPEVVRGLLD